jgi:hypothetical protein
VIPWLLLRVAAFGTNSSPPLFLEAALWQGRFISDRTIICQMAREVIPLGLGEGKGRPRLRAVGIGGAGCNAITSCHFEAVGLCSALDMFNSPPHHRRVVLTEESVRFMRSVSPRLLGTMDHEAVRRVRDALGESDMLFLFAGLGGETGSHLTPGMAHFGRRCSNLVVVSAALPFSVEGIGRKETARKALPEIKEAAHATITYPNDGLLKLAPNLPLRKAFKVMDSIMMFPPTELAQVVTREDLQALREDLQEVGERRGRRAQQGGPGGGRGTHLPVVRPTPGEGGSGHRGGHRQRGRRIHHEDGLGPPALPYTQCPGEVCRAFRPPDEWRSTVDAAPRLRSLTLLPGYPPGRCPTPPRPGPP